MALSIGYRNSVSFLPAIQATGRLTFAPVGLSPTEHASLRWTRAFPPHPPPAVSRFCSNDSSVLFRCPTPQRRACGPYGSCLHPPACRESSLQAPPRSPGSRAWNFQTCMGSTTTQGRTATRAHATVRVAFRYLDSVGALIADFRSSIPSPSFPLFTLHWTFRNVQCKTRGRAERYSFLARLLHPHFHAGLTRRTQILVLEQQFLIHQSRYIGQQTCPVGLLHPDRPSSQILRSHAVGLF